MHLSHEASRMEVCCNFLSCSLFNLCGHFVFLAEGISSNPVLTSYNILVNYRINNNSKCKDRYKCGGLCNSVFIIVKYAASEVLSRSRTLTKMDLTITQKSMTSRRLFAIRLQMFFIVWKYIIQERKGLQVKDWKIWPTQPRCAYGPVINSKTCFI
jgi:hypothetical protein